MFHHLSSFFLTKKTIQSFATMKKISGSAHEVEESSFRRKVRIFRGTKKEGQKAKQSSQQLTCIQNNKILWNLLNNLRGSARPMKWMKIVILYWQFNVWTQQMFNGSTNILRKTKIDDGTFFRKHLYLTFNIQMQLWCFRTKSGH